MKYYWLSCKDQRVNNWIFHSDSSESGVHLREQYETLKCPKCRKIDELAALDLEISKDVRIRSRSDWLRTNDGVVCISLAGRTKLINARITGVRFIELPNENQYSIVLPTIFAPTDASAALIELHRPCPACGRARETCGFPFVGSITLPADPLELICPDNMAENTRGREFWFLASEEATSALRRERLSGVDYHPAYCAATPPAP